MNDALKMQPPEKVCGTCQNIIQGPTDPQTLTPRFECRRFPPQMVMVGPGQINIMYPVINQHLPACGEHKVKIAVNS